jgi:hypothetical protein
MATALALRSWRLAKPVQTAFDLIAKLRRSTTYEGALEILERVDAEKQDVARIQTAVDDARVRVLAGESADIGGLEAQLREARERLRVAEMAPDLAERAVRHAETVALPRAAEPALQAQVDAFDASYSELMPQLIAAVQKLDGLNRQIGELDAQMRADFDHNHVAFRTASLRWPVKHRMGGLAFPVHPKVIENWIRFVREAGW